MRVAAALLALSLVTPLAAQEPGADERGGRTPPDAPTSQVMDRLRICRAAAIVELSNGKEQAGNGAWREVADVLLDQLAYVAAADILRTVPATVAMARERMEHAETVIMGFARVVSENREALSRQDDRRALLLDCIGPAWEVTSARIDRHVMINQTTGDRPAPPPRDRE